MENICQSCSMPMEGKKENYGTNKDGSLNSSYCSYCYQNGEFTSNMTMEEMIDFCVPYMVQDCPNLSKEEAKKIMEDLFPTLERWKK